MQQTQPSRRRPVPVLVVATAVVVAAVVVVFVLVTGRQSPQHRAQQRGRATSCVYTQNSVAAVQAFDTLVAGRTTCVMVYNDAASTWPALVSPWFAQGNDPDHRWDSWVKAQSGRQLVIGQSLIPANPPPDWRARGAAGEYDAQFTQLAGNLVSAGLGGSVIRLAFEGNGNWFIDNAGTSKADYAQWTAYWARVAAIFHHAAGGHYRLDWTITAGWRPIPLSQWYPGDEAVDIIGVDQHDIAEDKVGLSQPARWDYQRTQANGLDSVLGFAAKHDKPISVPEWGVDGLGVKGAGDDPYYMTQMADLFATRNVAYQGYWNKPGTGAQLGENPKSLAVYKSRVANSD